jgi:predicted transglutaminase-like cysteine proteinase
MESSVLGKFTGKLRSHLSVAFAAVALLPVTAAAATTAQAAPPRHPAKPHTPSVVHVFNRYLYKLPTEDNPDGPNFNRMASSQDRIMRSNDSWARDYRAYLHSFDDLRGLPIEQMAYNVNQRVLNSIGYIGDDAQYGFNYYAPPAQTWHNRRGDCDDYAGLQLDIMNYLGVSKDRLYMSIITTSQGHVVALIDVSKNKNGSRFIKMDMAHGAPYVRHIENSMYNVRDPSIDVVRIFNRYGYWATPSSVQKLYLDDPYSKGRQTLKTYHYKDKKWNLTITQTKDKRTAFVVSKGKHGKQHIYSVEFLAPKILYSTRTETPAKLPPKLRGALIYLNKHHMPPPGHKKMPQHKKVPRHHKH